MENIHSDYIKAEKELYDYIENNDKFLSRYEALLADMNNYIEKNNLTECVVVNEMVLGFALIDYFEDVKRLKQFHGVDHINAIKIIAYVSYWLLRRKPIQILVNKKELVDINERFVLAYIIGFLSSEENHSILERTEKGLNAFKESLLYFLKYRLSNANSLELMLISFFAGQIYQETKIDISSTISNLKLNFEQE